VSAVTQAIGSGEDSALRTIVAARVFLVANSRSSGTLAARQRSGVVEDQYSVGAAEVFGDAGLQVIADVIGVPAGAGE
jgi:hypothetical protein